jgi:DNA polymerase III delta prime subunit
MPIPQNLQESLREGRVVPFVGAGVSMSVLDRVSGKPLFPSWRQLLLDAADRLDNETKNADANLVRSLLNVNPPDFLDAAKRARQSLGPVWYSFLKEKFDIDFSTIDSGSLELARHVWRLGSNLVITTNYDEVLRWACPNQEDLQSWNIEAPVEQAFLLQGRLQRPVIWHLHGRISSAADLILSPDGYHLLYPETIGNSVNVKYEAALRTLQHQIASKSLLFIGFSLDDEYLGMQLTGVREVYKDAVGPHYAIVREEQGERVRSLQIEPVTFSGFGEPLLKLLGDLELAAELDTASLATRAGVSTVSIPDYGPHHSIFYVPFKQKGDEIVGQQHVITDVRNQLTQGKRTAIGQTASFRGLGGLGKTQLAIEYAYRYRNEYPSGVIWLNADQNIDAQLIEIAEKARWIAPESDHKYKLQIAQQRIRTYSDCLIVFDNLEDRHAIDPYLPEPEAYPHILVTSRVDHVDFQPVPLGLLDEHLSRELLLRESRRESRDDDDEKAIRSIVVVLGGLPLALELAGAYLGHRRTVSFQQYYDLLARDLKNALPKSVSSFTRHEADLYSTLRLSEDLLKEEDPLREVLDLLTWSGSAPMSSNLISHLLGIPNEVALARALALGNELRLLHQSKNSDSYSLHRLVGEVRRAEIPLQQRCEWVEIVCTRLGDWFQEKNDFSQLTEFESEIDHLKKWQENAAQFAHSQASRLMWLQAYPEYYRGRYVKAKDLVLEAKRLFDDLTTDNRALQASLLNDLANINLELGDSDLVLRNQMEALRIRRELFGESHRDVAISLSNLGGWFYKQGDFKRALDYSEQALKMRQELFGESHIDIANSLNNVGAAYFKLGSPERAFEYSERALAMRRKLFGEVHPDIASSSNNLGSLYNEKGESEKALEYSLSALTMRQELFGESHPDVAGSFNSVGNIYVEQGNVRQGLEYSQRALSIYREVFGDQHSSTIDTAADVANDLMRLNRRQEAYELVRHFLPKAQSQPLTERLERLEARLLSQVIRPGFRQPARTGKRKNKRKNRR